MSKPRLKNTIFAQNIVLDKYKISSANTSLILSNFWIPTFFYQHSARFTRDWMSWKCFRYRVANLKCNWNDARYYNHYDILLFSVALKNAQRACSTFQLRISASKVRYPKKTEFNIFYLFFIQKGTFIGQLAGECSKPAYYSNLFVGHRTLPNENGHVYCSPKVSRNGTRFFSLLVFHSIFRTVMHFAIMIFIDTKTNISNWLAEFMLRTADD